MVRFPFSSTLYVAFAGRLGLAVLTESMILFFSSSLRVLGSATSTFVPATGSYFLAVSRTTTLRTSVNCLPFLLRTRNPISSGPAFCVSATVPLYLLRLSLKMSVPDFEKK